MEKLRPCGQIENFSVARHHIGFYNSVGVTASYSCLQTTRPLQSLIYAALRILINTHPILGAIPRDEHTGKPFFVRLKSIDLHICTMFLERRKHFSPSESEEADEELDNLLESQHALDWKDPTATKPYWRVIVLHSPGTYNEFMVSWIYHHALSDGTSGLVFHNDLLAAFNSIGRSEVQDDRAIVSTPNLALIPSLEALHKLPLSIDYVLQGLWRTWFPKRHPKLWTGSKISNDPKLKTLRFRTIVLSKTSTTQLLQLSRDNHTTITGTLECVTSSAVLANLDPEIHDRVVVDGAISFRRFLNPPHIDISNQIGVYVSVYHNEHVRPVLGYTETNERSGLNVSKTAYECFSWAEAQAVRSTILKEIAKQGRNSAVGLLRWAGNQNTFWLKKIGKHREETFEITNIGAWKPQSKGNVDEWHPGRVVFSQASAVSGPAFALSVSTGCDGCLVLGFSWLEGIVETPFMKNVMENVKSCIDSLLENTE